MPRTDIRPTGDRIIYTLIHRPGGVDGRDHTDKGGQMLAATYSRGELAAHPGAPWCDVVPEVVDLRAAYMSALAKLSPLDRLVLGLPQKPAGNWAPSKT